MVSGTDIIELSIVDYTPTHGTENLTSDSCSAYVETYRYKVLDHNNVAKYFRYANQKMAKFYLVFNLFRIALK